jgi:lysophospholipase L1-like esterase
MRSIPSVLWFVPIAGLFAACGGHGSTNASGAPDPQEDPVDAGGATVPPSHDPDPDPGPPAVQLIGRFDTRDPAGPLAAWPGGRIIARFSGASVSARLHEQVEDWMHGTPSEWDVIVDGALQPKLVTSAGETKDYVLATGLPRGEHVVELYRRTEAQTGLTQFLGFDFGDGALLPPPPRKARRIEVIGDSAATGLGVEGAAVGPDCPGVEWAARWENFHESFGALLGEALDAEVMGTAYSGKGMVKDIWPEDKDTMPIIFPRANPIDTQSSWDSHAYVPQLVLVTIGGNDFAIGQPVDEGPATPEDFTNTYDAFVVMLRARYPEAEILLIASASLSDSEPPGRNTRTNVVAGIAQVLSRRQAAGDTHVDSFAPNLASASELTGCDSHGNPALHQRIAVEVGVRVRSLLAW